jgi:hypothetical protein
VWGVPHGWSYLTPFGPHLGSLRRWSNALQHVGERMCSHEEYILSVGPGAGTSTPQHHTPPQTRSDHLQKVLRTGYLPHLEHFWTPSRTPFGAHLSGTQMHHMYMVCVPNGRVVHPHRQHVAYHDNGVLVGVQGSSRRVPIWHLGLILELRCQI